MLTIPFGEITFGKMADWGAPQIVTFHKLLVILIDIIILGVLTIFLILSDARCFGSGLCFRLQCKKEPTMLGPLDKAIHCHYPP
jgi:hypothetical protein